MKRICPPCDGECKQGRDCPADKEKYMKAFPNMTGQTGMDLLDYFAAKAMQGMLANRGVIYGTNADEDDYNGAKRAYKIADAMMKAREEK
jgi:hypothetical protein